MAKFQGCAAKATSRVSSKCRLHVRARFESSEREMIGSPENPTPLVRVNRALAPGGLELYLKLEWLNPFGSIKDRTAAF